MKFTFLFKIKIIFFLSLISTEIFAQCTAVNTAFTANCDGCATSVSYTLGPTTTGFMLDVFTLDNSFNVTVNGTKINTKELEFEYYTNQGTTVTLPEFVSDGAIYNSGGTVSPIETANAIWQMNGTAANPLIRIIIDGNGNTTIYGSRVGQGPLFPMRIRSGYQAFNAVTWNATSNNTVSITQAGRGPTNMTGLFIPVGVNTPVLSTNNINNACNSSTTTLSLAGLVTNTCTAGSVLQWHTVSTNFSSSTLVPSSTAVGNGTYYPVCYSSGNSCYGLAANPGVTATIILPPVAPSYTYCQGATATQLSATATNGSALRWYTAATGGTASSTAPTPSTATAGTTTYYVSQKWTSCETSRTPITVTVNAKPSPPTAVGVTYCQRATSSALTATGTNLLWYTAATGGTGSATAPTPSTATVGTTNYYVSQTVDGCESNRTTVAVVVKTTPNAPVANSVGYCQGATATPLTATATGGATLQWYTVATGGTASTTAPTPSTTSVGSTTYYVSQLLNGCESIQTAVGVVINPNPILTLSAGTITCGATKGTITSSTTGGTPAYSYSINGGGSYQASNVFTGIASGSYTITVKDSKGCVNSQGITVTQNDPLSLVSEVTYDCSSGNNGIISISGTGGGAPLVYNLDGGAYGGTTFFSNLAAGSHTVSVRDKDNCIVSSTVNVNAITDLTLSLTSQNNCIVGSTGTITVSASGGLSPYSYRINGGVFGGATTFNGLAAGTHTVDVKDTRGCTKSVSATIIEKPAAPTTTSPTICLGSSTTLSATCASGTVKWYSNSALTVALPSSTVSPTTATTYYATCEITSISCKSLSTSSLVSVNPVPTVNAVSNQLLCKGSNTSAVAFTGAVAGTVYNWTNSNTGSGLAGSGSGDIASFSADNAGTSPIVSTITVTPSYTNNGVTCTGTPRSFTITVNPTPTADNISNQIVCNGQNTTLAITGAATSYNWSYNSTNIGLASSGTLTASGANSSASTSFTATNSSNAPVSATIMVTPFYTSGGLTCSGTPKIFTITVNHTPTVDNVSSQVKCNNTASDAINFSGNNSSNAYDWSHTNIAVGLTGTGSGNIGSFTATNTGSSPIISTFTVTPKYTNGATTCIGTAKTFNFTVNHTPTVDIISSQVKCNNTSTDAINFSGNNISNAYSWSHSNTAIGLTGTGSSNIASFNATNSGSSPISSTFTVTPSYTNGGITCTGPSKSFGITVNHTPTVNVVSDQAKCNTIATDAINFSGNNPSNVYAWSQTNTAIGLGVSTGSGNIASFTTTNTGATPISSTFTVTPSFTNAGLTCIGAAKTFAITVHPTPQATITPSTLNICSGDNISMTISDAKSVPGTTTYAWNRDNTTNITGLNSGTNNTISGVLNNITASTQTTIFTGTVTSQFGCVNSTTATVKVTPPLSVTIAGNTYFCGTGGLNNSTKLTATPVGGNGVYTYQWNLNSSPISGATNSTYDASAAGNYTVTVKSEYCTKTSNIIIVNSPYVLGANPTVSPNPVTVCFNNTATFTASSTAANPTFNWYASATSTSTIATGVTYTTPSITANQTYYVSRVLAIVGTNPSVTCETDRTAANVNLSTLAVSETFKKNVSCNNGNDGQIIVSSSGALGTVSYTINPSSGTQSPLGTFNNLTANTYTITAKDASNNCTTSTTVTISAPAVVTFSLSKTDVTSCVIGNGSITVSANGGTVSYQYSIDNGATYQASNVFSNLASGSYIIKVKDANGCLSQATTVTINPQSNFPSVNGVQATSTTCPTSSDGKITFGGTGGSSPYTYSINNGSSYQSSDTFTGLSTGSYQVKVKDSNGCESSATIVALNSVSNLVLTTTTTNVLCNGGNTGKIVATTSGGVGSTTYTISPIVGTQSPSGIFTNLIPNTYTITVTDKNGCTLKKEVTVSEPTALTASLSSTAVLCKGEKSGSATVVASEGTSPYSYVWSEGQTTATASNLAAGSYTVVVTDKNGCTLKKEVTVSEPTALTASLSSTAVLCKGEKTGSATVVASEGTSPYSYVWSEGQTTATASNLAAGSYTVVVTDKNGCTLKKEVTVSEPTALTASLSSTAVLCKGEKTGSATVVASEGTSPYSYVWNDTANQTTATASNLAAGSYTVVVTDKNGCTLKKEVTVSEPTALTASLSSTAVLCKGEKTGSATVVASEGTSPYSYVWSDGQTTATASNLAAGSYTVVVTDKNGCTLKKEVTVSEPTALTASLSSTAVLCKGEKTGSATVVASEGTSPYSYVWNDTANQTTATASNLAAGSYTVVVTDKNGCTLKKEVTVSEPTALTASLSSTAVLCKGEKTGSATVVASEGTSPYSYVWSDGQTTATASNLAAGSYTVVVTDKNGCTLKKEVTVSEPTALTASLSSTAVLCKGEKTGSATVVASEGTSPYSYVWSEGQTTATASNLAAGSYTVVVTDKNGCTLKKEVTVSEPTALTASLSSTAVLCKGEKTGSATVVASEGTSPYSYVWSEGQTTATASNLAAGSYTVVVTDKNGCTLKKEVTVSEPTALTASLSSTAVLCKGEKTGSATVVASEGTSPYSYVWSEGQTTATASNLAAGNYTVVVTDKNGCTLKKEVTVSEPTALTASLSSTAVLCKGEKTGSATVVASEGTSPYSYVWSEGQTTATASNLAAGSYTVVVTDKNGCTLKKEVTVSEPTVLTASLSSTAVLCKGEKTGSATVVASEGTSPYSYVWSEGQTTATASNLAAGNYTVVVTDKNGCTLKKEVTVSEPTALTASLSSTAVLCKGEKTGSATVVASEGTSPYSYVWSDGQTTATASNLAAGSYTVVVTDKNGCTLKKEVTVSEPTALTASLSSTAVLCKGEKTGSATVVASEGTSPYSYVWSDGQTTATASNLAAGSYTVVVTDKNGCTLKKEVTVSEPTALTASLSSTAVLCKGEKTGSATVVASEGTSPYSYVWNDTANQTTATASNLAAGSYTVVVTDKNGCTLKKEVTVSEPTALTASLSSTAVLCKGEKTGSATVVASEGTSPYSYVWNDTANQTTATASNLAAGSYTVVVTDKNGCTLKKEVTVSEPTALTASLSSTAVLCKGEKTGSATVVASEGTSPYSYVWNDTANQTTATASNLAAGSYTVVVTDKNGCTLKKEVTVSEPTALTASLSSTAVLCKGEKTGSATVVASEGTSPYSYVWNDTANQTTATASNLAAGSYTVVVTDKNGCTLKKEVTVSEPTALTASLSSTAVLCKGEKTGSATVVASEGTSPYSYVWSDGQTTATASNLAAGSYTVVVTDKNGCTLKKEVTVSEPTALTASLSSTAVLCKGEKTGSATVVASEGTSPYSYVWSDGQTTATASNLAAGSYTVVVTDKNGCTLKKEVTVSEPTALTASLSSTAVLCKGEKTGSATVVASEGTSPYSYVWNDTANQTTATASNLAAGNYTVVVTDKNGCTLKKEVTVSEPTALTASLSSTAVLCKGEKTGSATVVASEGTSPYSYVWNDTANQTTATASNLAAGNYTVVVTDKNGCTLKKEVTVSEPTALTASLSSTAVLCKGEKTGSATVVASEGTSPYSYVWSDGQTTATASNLAAGSYTVVVTDKNGCTLKKEVTVSEPTALTASLSSTAVLCKGEKTGSATVVASEGTSPYSYVWSDGQTTATASNLAAGSYTVVVTDKNGCTLKKEVTVSEPTALTASLSSTAVLCKGEKTGSATVVASEGTSPYSYVWNDTANQTTATASNLAAGNYTVVVTDKNGCTLKKEVTVSEPTALTASLSSTAVLCKGEKTGSATVVASEGTSPYSYVWNDTANQTTATASNLAAGNYTVVVTDKNGCTLKKEVTVSEPTALTASLSSTAVLCKGEKTGSATVVASEGTSPYSYVWSDGQTTATASNLAAGSYTVVVTDKNGCTLKKEVTVSEPTALTASLSSTAVLCKGEKTGSATVVASEGTSPYSYVWSDGQTTATASNLAAGSYTVVVTDKNGCTLKKEVTVSEPTALTASLSSTAVLCKGEKTGSATVVASEGTSPYSYVWSEGQTTATASNLAAGSYTVVVTDKNGCTLKKEVTVSEPTALTASLSSTAVLCKGEKTGSATVVASEGTSPYSYVWNDTANQTTATASNLAAGSYTVVVTDKNGCTLKKEVTVSEPTALTASLSSTAVLCKGEKTGSATVVASEGTSPYSYVWNDTANQTTATASNLAAGSYTVVVTDKNGCTLKKEVTVSEPTALTASLSSTAVLCKGEKTGSATVVASEGTSPYSYVWSDGQTTATASNLAAGSYTVVVTDKNGCTLKKEVTVSEPTALTASLSSTAVLCKGEKTGSATVVASEGTSPYSYVWNDTANQTTATASNLAAGSYTVVVTDKNGCTLKKEVTVSEPTALTASLSSTAVLCKGEKTGSATVVASEGTSPYSYVWNDTANQTTATASNLAAGSYTVVVTDKNGCTLKKEVTVSEPTALTASLSSTAVLCKGEKTGSATVVASEGTSPYSYVWSDGQTTATASNLAAGSYTVVVTDKNGCTLKKEVTVSEPTALTASLSSTAVLCKGEKTGSATVVASEGTSPYSYVWSDGQTTATASNLAAGSYTVVVTDKNGCTLKKEVTVSEPTALTASLSSTAVLCKGEKTGSATVVASEGTSPYSYVWNDTANQTTATASNLAAGSYTVVVTDKNGCTLKKEVTVSEPTALTASLSSTAVLCKGEKTGSATVVASEGTSPYSYVWSEGQTTATASNLAAGSYTVVVTDKNGCTLKKEVTVSEPTALTASLSSTAVLCKGEKTGSCHGSSE